MITLITLIVELFLLFLSHLYIPFTGRNSILREAVVGNKPYVYVLNKADLADLRQRDRIEAKLKAEGYWPCIFTNLRSPTDSNTRQVGYDSFHS